MLKLIKLKDFESHIASDTKIIKARDYLEYKAANELIHKTLERIKKKEQAISLALVKALKRGHTEGLNKANAEMADQIIRSASSANQRISSVEGDLINAVMQTVRKIVRDFSNEELVFNAVQNSLELIRDTQAVHIRIHPDTQAGLQQRLDELNHDVRFLHLIADDTLKLDDCILETESGIINANIEQQIETIAKALGASIH